MTKDSEHAREQAKAQMESVSDMVARLRAATDDEAYEDLAPTLAKEAGFEVIGGGDSWCYRSVKKGADEDVSVYTTEEEAWVACCNDNGLRPDEDDARRAIEEDPLSVQVRSGWHSLGEKLEAAEYEVLLCTGGPAVRIVGDLDEYNEPLYARMDYQDWGTPWTEYFDVNRDDLLAYVSFFYFGEYSERLPVPPPVFVN